MRYRDVARAIDWLCAAFGFEKKAVVAGDGGAIGYAQLTFGDAMIMLEPVGDTALDGFMKQPDEIGGAETQSCYFTVPDADVHYAAARAAGALIVSDIADFENGGRGYSCRDPEGHVWTFGTYDPWQGHRARSEVTPDPAPRASKRWLTRVATLGCLAGAVAAGAWINDLRYQTGSAQAVRVESEVEERAVQAAMARLAAEQSVREAAERNAREVGEQMRLEREAREAVLREVQDLQRSAAAHQAAREVAERAARQASEELLLERRARETAERQAQHLQQQAALQTGSTDVVERTVRETREQVERERSARDAAERAVRELQERLAAEQGSRERVERDIGEARGQLGREQTARAAVERDVEDARRQLDEQRAARETAERTAQDMRAQLEAEQNAKRIAWRIVGELRKQIGLMQRRAKSGAEAGGNDVAASAAAPAARPKPQRKRKPAGNAPDE